MNSADTASPMPTKIQLSRSSGDQEMSATGIQIRLAYPYNAQHSKTFAASLPDHRSAAHKAKGTTAMPVSFLQRLKYRVSSRTGVPIYQPQRSAQQLEVVAKVPLTSRRQPVAYASREEENNHHGRRDPERTIQIWIAVEDVEKVCTREERGGAPAQDLGRIDVEELRVEGDAPEVALRAERI